jgi:CIC family chloride channel protein
MEGKKLSGMLKLSVDDRDKYLLSKIDLSELIENTFLPIKPTDNLDQLVKTISISTRNIFPVINEKDELAGIIHLDDVRGVIFNAELYDTLKVKDLMKVPAAVISPSDSLHDILKKFDETHEWNLPLVEDRKYRGFVSKSSILSRYRLEILKTI